MRVEVVRRGGIMGVARRGTVDTSELAAGVAGPAEESLRGLVDGRVAAAPQHPDGFRYRILTEAEGVRTTAELDESELPEALRPVVAAALARGGGE